MGMEIPREAFEAIVRLAIDALPTVGYEPSELPELIKDLEELLEAVINGESIKIKEAFIPGPWPV